MLAISGGLFVDYFNVDQPLDLIISAGAPSARAAAPQRPVSDDANDLRMVQQRSVLARPSSSQQD
jgi:hypothetical protein